LRLAGLACRAPGAARADNRWRGARSTRTNLRLLPVLDEESQPVGASPQCHGTSLNVAQLSSDHLQLDGGIGDELLGFHVTSQGTAPTLRRQAREVVKFHVCTSPPARRSAG